jgi:hypothetical protein
MYLDGYDGTKWGQFFCHLSPLHFASRKFNFHLFFFFSQSHPLLLTLLSYAGSPSHPNLTHKPFLISTLDFLFQNSFLSYFPPKILSLQPVLFYSFRRSSLLSSSLIHPPLSLTAVLTWFPLQFQCSGCKKCVQWWWWQMILLRLWLLILYRIAKRTILNLPFEIFFFSFKAKSWLNY